MPFNKGGLIDRLSKDTEILKVSKTTNEIGQVDKVFSIQNTIQMYITSTGGNRSNVAERESLVQLYVGQTTEKYAGIKINDLIRQGAKVYRITDIDDDAANVGIEAEYKLIREDNLQGLLT